MPASTSDRLNVRLQNCRESPSLKVKKMLEGYGIEAKLAKEQ
nr:hypothetical protein [Bacillus licheniformis]